jgi:hypothetical protein
MQETADLTLLVQLSGTFFHPPDQYHLVVQV